MSSRANWSSGQRRITAALGDHAIPVACIVTPAARDYLASTSSRPSTQQVITHGDSVTESEPEPANRHHLSLRAEELVERLAA
jgi:hypothetical protein